MRTGRKRRAAIVHRGGPPHNKTLDVVTSMAYTGSTFYCRACADRLGFLTGLNPVSSSPSTYQGDKAVKHTNPTALSTGLHSVLNSGSTAEYRSLEQLTYNHGFLEVERSGVRTLILQTTAAIGTIYDNAARVGGADSFRRVLSTDSGSAHGYPESSTSYSGITCANCSARLTF